MRRAAFFLLLSLPAAARAAFQKAYYKASEQIYAAGSQTSLAMPLALSNHTGAGDIGCRYVLAALAGIRPGPSSPGLSKIRVEPQPSGGVTWVKSSLDTHRGPLAVNCRIDAGLFHLALDVPPGLVADVLLPKGAFSLPSRTPLAPPRATLTYRRSARSTLSGPRAITVR